MTIGFEEFERICKMYHDGVALFNDTEDDYVYVKMDTITDHLYDIIDEKLHHIQENENEKEFLETVVKYCVLKNDEESWQEVFDRLEDLGA